MVNDKRLQHLLSRLSPDDLEVHHKVAQNKNLSFCEDDFSDVSLFELDLETRELVTTVATNHIIN